MNTISKIMGAGSTTKYYTKATSIAARTPTNLKNIAYDAEYDIGRVVNIMV